MRIAVCYSGYIRTGAIAAAWHNHFFDGTDIDVFMHTWSTSKNKLWHPESINYVIDNQKIVEENSIPKIVEFQNALERSFVSLLVEDQSVWEKSAIFPSNQVSPLWYSWAKSINLVNDYSRESSTKYDLILKMRPDIIFPKTHRLVNEFDHFNQNKNIFYAMAYNDFRIDDVMFYATPEIMYRASKFYEWLKNLNCRWQTNIFAEYMNEIKIQATGISLPASYACIRPETQHLKTFDEIFWGERKYYAPKKKFTQQMTAAK
jgi:hypothetical protein